MAFDCQDGVAEVRIDKWIDFARFVEALPDPDRYIWRGHSRASYRLEPTLKRACRDRGIRFDPFMARKHLGRFRQAIRGRVMISDRLMASDEEVWALGQHYGLATPLLDWTESCYVSAYFAFAKDGPNHNVSEEDRALFALDAKAIEQIYYQTLQERINTLAKRYDLDFLDFERIPTVGLLETPSEHPDQAMLLESILRREIPVAPEQFSKCKFVSDMALQSCIKLVSPLSGENPRLVNQSGLFTLILQHESLEQWVSNKFKGREDLVLIKILLPDKETEKARADLRRMNLNPLSLFPDLQGSSQYCNELLLLEAKPFDWSKELGT